MTSPTDCISPADMGAVSQAIGSIAAVLTTLSFFPQAYLTLKTRDVRGISLGMYVAFTLGVALWLVYGVLIGAWPVIIANAVTLLLVMTILSMKLRYGGTAVPHPPLDLKTDSRATGSPRSGPA